MSQTVIQRLAERIRSFGDKNVTKQAIELSSPSASGGKSAWHGGCANHRRASPTW
jgi:hypothetical protein